MKNLKKIPKFKTEMEEIEFWNKEDSSEYINWDEAKDVKFTNLKKTTRKILYPKNKKTLKNCMSLRH